MALNATPGPALQPSAEKTILNTNYISLFDYSNQYLPDVHADLVRRYGNQSVVGFLNYLGAEMSMESDQTTWSEKGRLHDLQVGVNRVGLVLNTTGPHTVRVNETVTISDATATDRALVTAVTATTITVAPYAAAGLTVGTTALQVFVDGSEYRQGSAGVEGSLDTTADFFTNKPVIIRDKFSVSGSRMTQVSWVKVKGGYIWYLESEFDTRQRYDNKKEMTYLTGVLAEAGSGAATAGYGGTEGVFTTVRSRGNVYDGLATTIAEVDTIVKRFDQQGKIQETMWHLDRDQSLAIDDLLGELNAGYSGGLSFGSFDNEKEAINLGFTAFKRGSYNFYKSDWKLLNDPTLLGSVAVGAGKVRGLISPVGEEEIYERSGAPAGNNTVPYLHVLYRAAAGEVRKDKSWATGSAGHARTSEEDALNINFLNEGCVRTVAANNFMIFEE